MRRAAILLAVILAFSAAQGQESVSFTAAETARILHHGPWPPTWPGDRSNRVSGRDAAIAFGEQQSDHRQRHPVYFSAAVVVNAAKDVQSNRFREAQ